MTKIGKGKFLSIAIIAVILAISLAFGIFYFNSDGYTVAFAEGEITLGALPDADGYTTFGWTDGVDLFSAGDTVPDGEYKAVYAKMSVPESRAKLNGEFGMQFRSVLSVKDDAIKAKDLVEIANIEKVTLYLSYVDDGNGKTYKKTIVFDLTKGLAEGDDQDVEFIATLYGNAGNVADKSLKVDYTFDFDLPGGDKGNIEAVNEGVVPKTVAIKSIEYLAVSEAVKDMPAEDKATYASNLLEYFGVENQDVIDYFESKDDGGAAAAAFADADISFLPDDDIKTTFVPYHDITGASLSSEGGKAIVTFSGTYEYMTASAVQALPFGFGLKSGNDAAILTNVAPVIAASNGAFTVKYDISTAPLGTYDVLFADGNGEVSAYALPAAIDTEIVVDGVTYAADCAATENFEVAVTFDYEIDDVDIVNENGAPVLVYTVAYPAGLSDETVLALDWNFDIQSNENSSGASDPDPRLTGFEADKDIEGGKLIVKYNLSTAAKSNYMLHFGFSREAGDPSLYMPGVEVNKNIVINDGLNTSVYVLVCNPEGSTGGVNYHRGLGLKIANKDYTVTNVEIEAIGENVVVWTEGTYLGFTDEEFLAQTWTRNLEENSSRNTAMGSSGGSWQKYLANADGDYIYDYTAVDGEFRIGYLVQGTKGNLTANLTKNRSYTIHFAIGSKNDGNLYPETTGFEKSVVVNGIMYRIVYYPEGSTSDGSVFWATSVGIDMYYVVNDLSASSLTLSNNTVNFVVTGSNRTGAQTYARLINANDPTTGSPLAYQQINNNAAFTLTYNVTNLDVGTYTGFGVNFLNAYQPVYDLRSATNGVIASKYLNGKLYKLINTDGVISIEIEEKIITANVTTVNANGVVADGGSVKFAVTGTVSGADEVSVKLQRTSNNDNTSWADYNGNTFAATLNNGSFSTNVTLPNNNNYYYRAIVVADEVEFNVPFNGNKTFTVGQKTYTASNYNSCIRVQVAAAIVNEITASSLSNQGVLTISGTNTLGGNRRVRVYRDNSNYTQYNNNANVGNNATYSVNVNLTGLAAGTYSSWQVRMATNSGFSNNVTNYTLSSTTTDVIKSVEYNGKTYTLRNNNGTVQVIITTPPTVSKLTADSLYVNNDQVIFSVGVFNDTGSNRDVARVVRKDDSTSYTHAAVAQNASYTFNVNVTDLEGGVYDYEVQFANNYSNYGAQYAFYQPVSYQITSDINGTIKTLTNNGIVYTLRNNNGSIELVVESPKSVNALTANDFTAGATALNDVTVSGKTDGEAVAVKVMSGSDEISSVNATVADGSFSATVAIPATNGTYSIVAVFDGTEQNVVKYTGTAKHLVIGSSSYDVSNNNGVQIVIAALPAYSGSTLRLEAENTQYTFTPQSWSNSPVETGKPAASGGSAMGSFSQGNTMTFEFYAAEASQVKLDLFISSNANAGKDPTTFTSANFTVTFNGVACNDFSGTVQGGTDYSTNFEAVTLGTVTTNAGLNTVVITMGASGGGGNFDCLDVVPSSVIQ